MNEISLFDRFHYSLTKNKRTEDFYRLLYEKIRDRYFSKKENCLVIKDLKLPVLSNSAKPTREEAYIAMEIADILFPAKLSRYHFCDEGPYEWGDVFISEGDTVFDCGANIGIFSILAASKGAEVYAFEPIFGARKILRTTLELNPEFSKQIHIVPYALADVEEKAEFKVLDNTYVGSSMVLMNQIGHTEISDVTTVDIFAEKNNLHVDFIKADIEGAERKMLEGAQKTLSRNSPKISICKYHLADDPQVLKSLILKANKDYVLTEKWKKIYGAVTRR
ncbi:MAG: FkbM family methyltransferase [Methanocorpusculum sp.]|nr:FkbM family methyltransferase [Methanocorpusculum sp.]